MSRAGIITHVKHATNMVVQTGPFAGLRLHDMQTWGNGEDIGPQLLGVYEAELHEVILRAVARRPAVVINVGCAEGYYAVGLARLLPAAEVHAFDIDAQAQQACRANAVLNGVADRVHVAGACSPARLAAIAKAAAKTGSAKTGGAKTGSAKTGSAKTGSAKTGSAKAEAAKAAASAAAQHSVRSGILAVVDCEGCEKSLLGDRRSRQALHGADIVVEAHDFADRSITPALIAAYDDTHDVELIPSGGRNPHQFGFLDHWTDADKWMLVCENRPELQIWIALRSKEAHDAT